LKGWAFPLVVIGANSIAAYVMAHLLDRFVLEALHTHLGRDVFQSLGDAYTPLMNGAAVLTVYWLILFWMYRRRLFLKI
jgi:predicted acyltransferase